MWSAASTLWAAGGRPFQTNSGGAGKESPGEPQAPSVNPTTRTEDAMARHRRTWFTATQLCFSRFPNPYQM
ncbi:unnamed protein product [Arctogadus glacialis]